MFGFSDWDNLVWLIGPSLTLKLETEGKLEICDGRQYRPQFVTGLDRLAPTDSWQPLSSQETVPHLPPVANYSVRPARPLCSSLGHSSIQHSALFFQSEKSTGLRHNIFKFNCKTKYCFLQP